ncbi:MAG: hypothetical protein JJT89_08145 [Nitriliruptoraceae bacterium]|nr:hypothetical protein [Nitriliruptoraceae bacterium]
MSPLAIVLLVLAPLTPLLVGVVGAPRAGRRRWWLAVAAPLPALVLAGSGLDGELHVPVVLLGATLEIDGIRRLLLAAVGLVWLLAAASGRSLLDGPTSPLAAWGLAASGSLGVVLAGDTITLYTAFAVMTFAAYPLVIHRGTDDARRAGRAMIAMAVLGEALLLSGLLLVTVGAGDPALGTVRAAIAGGEVGVLGPALVTAGFAVKAGLVPLHLWLPLAHPAAPVPASAVLSGAMIKAGVIGWLLVLPVAGPAGAPAVIGTALLVVGTVTMFTGAGFGVLSSAPKVVLAYSSISQMGVLAMIAGAGLLASDPAGTTAFALAVYVLHHGLAKAVLFLAAGAAEVARRRVVLGVAGLAGLALAGAPLTSGAGAKLLAKDVLGAVPTSGGLLTTTLSVGSIATTLLVVRLLALLAAATDPASTTAADAATTGLWVLAALVALVPWAVPWVVTGEVVPVGDLGAVVEASWPIAVGLVLAASAVVLVRRRPGVARIAVPPGDLLVPLGRVGLRVSGGAIERGQQIRAAVGRWRTRGRNRVRDWELPGRLMTLDEQLTRWRPTGVAFLALAVAFAWVLRTGS